MKPTREQCLKWAEEAFASRGACKEWFVDTAPNFEALCQRVWNEAMDAGIEAMGRNAQRFSKDILHDLKATP